MNDTLETTTWKEWRSGRPRTREATITAGVDGGFNETNLVKFVLRSRHDLLAERVFDADSSSWVPATADRRVARHGETTAAQTLGQGRMAAHLGYSEKDLSLLLSPDTNVDRDDVRSFEHRLLSFAFEQRGATPSAVRSLGWLTSYFDELSDRNASEPNFLLARWHADLCEGGPNNSAEALVLGEALLGLVAYADVRGGGGPLWEAYADEANRTVRGLIAVATRPAAAGATPAIQIAAQLGHRVLPTVEEHLTRSALGFRATRIVTRMLHLVRSPQRRPRWWLADGAQEIDGCRALLRMLDERTSDPDPEGLPDPYPARSFYVEALRELARTGRDLGRPELIEDADHLLTKRLVDRSGTRPVRERIYAAYCLWELHGPTEALTQLIRNASMSQPEERAWHYLTHVLDFARSSNLEAAIIDGISSWNTAANGAYEADITLRHRATAGHSDDGALSYLDRLPRSVQRGAGRLLRYALLSPDGTLRRRACETLKEAGVASEAAGIVAAVMLDDDSPRWLQETSAFVLGVLADPSSSAALISVGMDGGRDVTVRHAAVWALGDLQHPRVDTLDLILDLTSDPSIDVSLLHAATYSLGVLRPPVRPQSAAASGDLDRRAAAQLAQLSSLMDDGQDRITRKLARWGVENLDLARRRGSPERMRENQIWGLNPLP